MGEICQIHHKIGKNKHKKNRDIRTDTPVVVYGSAITLPNERKDYSVNPVWRVPYTW